MSLNPSAAMQKVVGQLLAARDAGATLPPELVKAVEEAATLGLTADRLSAILAPMPSMIGQAVGQTSAWASAMAGVGAEIRAIMSSLSAIGGGVVSNAAKRTELVALQAGQTIRQAEVARLRFENEQKLTAQQMAANAKGGVAGWAGSQLVGMQRYQFDESIRLDDQLNAQREAARKAESKSTGGGGKGSSGSRAEALGDESRSLVRLSKDMNNRIFDLGRENDALALLIGGQATTLEGAQMLADAQRMGGEAIDQQTKAIVRQYEQAVKLNDALQRAARDPVKEWMDSVPGWVEAGKSIQATMTETFSTTLADVMKTGTFDAEGFADALFAPVFDAVAQKATKELLTALGAADGGALSGLIGSLGLQSAGDTDMSGLATSAGPAGQTIAAVLMQQAPSIGSAIASGMAGIGPQIATSAQSGLAAGSNSVRQAGQQGLAAGANNIRIAATTSGPVLGRGVVMGATQGAPILAQGVAMGAQAGGMGSGIFEGLGGWGGIASMVLGAFSEGGYSTSPVGTATMPAAAFRHAPSYAEGTANTSGIPAILHPSEAVVPLSRGRAIPVDLGDNAGGQSVVQHMTFHIQTNDADSFKRSQKQIAADMARAGQTALRQNG